MTDNVSIGNAIEGKERRSNLKEQCSSFAYFLKSFHITY